MRGRAILITGFLWGFGLSGCTERSAGPPRPAPMSFVTAVLRLHDLEGRHPEARSEAARRKAVDRAALERLFAGYAEEDPFLADLYVGFIVGSLAANQERLQVFEQGGRAEIRAGNTRISLRLDHGHWRASLQDSIPEAVKARAKMEKLRVADRGRISRR